jgi:hypothetical protein
MSMGIGTFLQNNANIKRKFRWSLGFGPTSSGAGSTFSKSIRPIMVQVAARPNLTIEETEISFMNERDYIPAKPSWDSLQVTFLDYAKVGGGGADEVLIEWLQSCYAFGDPATSGQMSDPVGQCRRDGTLTMYSGTGAILEIWTLYACWLQVANFGDLDYSSTENATLEATIRYMNAKVVLKNGVSQKAGYAANELAGG